MSTELTRSELLPVCVAGDVVLETGYLARVVEAFDPARQAASVAVRQVAGSTGFDAVDIEDGTGVGVRTGPADPTVPTAGAVASTPALLDHASTLHPPREALVDALDSLVAAGGPVHAEAGFWTAIASAEDVLDANRVLLDRHSHAVDRHAPPDETLRGRVEFGESTVVQGPVVLGRDVTVARVLASDPIPAWAMGVRSPARPWNPVSFWTTFPSGPTSESSTVSSGATPNLRIRGR